MAGRYTADFLLHLRESPLCVKPPGLPPAEEWMGPPPETFRNQTKTTNDRVKTGLPGDGLLLGQENRRPPLDRIGTRGAANPDEFLGPPRSAFASATAARNNRNAGESDKGLKESERQDRSDRFNFRSRTGDADTATNDRFRDRDTRNNFRRRGDQDQDSEGWSTVKPRKSFGTEGAERFHGRMGAAGERFGGRDDRRTRDRDDRDGNDRRNRNADKDGDDADGTPKRNALARGKSEPWYRDSNNDNGGGDAPVSQRERIEKAKSWRDRDPEVADRRGDRGNERGFSRWDRDSNQRVERDPEWLDEPADDNSRVHTAQDLQKFMASMKAKQGDAGAKPEEKTSAVADKSAFDVSVESNFKVSSAPVVDAEPDKFFETFGGQQFGGGALPATSPAADGKDSIRQKGAKASRFLSFLTPQDETRPRTEPPTPAGPVQGGGSAAEAPIQTEADKEAFKQLIQKLQKSTNISAAGPPPSSIMRLFEQPPPPEAQPKSAVASPEPYQQYVGDPREDPRLRPPQSQLPMFNMISPRQMMPPTQPPPVSRADQAVQALLAQHGPHVQRPSLPNPAGNRGGQTPSAQNDASQFLMGLMRSQGEPLEPQRSELPVRMPQPTKQVSLANIPDREQDYHRERSATQRQQQQIQQQMRMQQGPPPGFMDEQFHSPDMDSRPQPTQILQRPPPPGLDHHGMHPFQMGGAPAPGAGAGGQMPPAPQRPMIPPPGLPRNLPMPGMFPPNVPMPGYSYGPPPPEVLANVGLPQGGPVNRGMQPPPGFFGAHTAPNFMPPPPGMNPGFQGGPDGPGAFPGGLPGVPFDRRGMLPPGAYRGP
ncbi:hypothetical protein QBC47DRAFT_371793 [Echria macrotheca]|uniref:Uncharacterized protein n=1 Tax=Echria macrotheca TaxID=438768 RepID=A0AAJ0FDJ4_9PEZI|nr:hypothetical protein QBC47DRAFT_371793 [Echria macrotheca]